MADGSNPMEEIVRTLLASPYVVALVGAGMSVESGIPPYQGPGGFWSESDEPDMSEYERFLLDPKGWWEANLELEGHISELDDALEKAQPNPGHYALVELERMGILKYTIIQNVDNLHYLAGSQKVAEIRGNRTKLRCISCVARFPREEFVVKDLPPQCPRCGNIVKRDDMMFGEPIPADVLMASQREASLCQCLLLLGTSGTANLTVKFTREVKSQGGCLIEVNPYETYITQICDLVLRMPTGQALPQIVDRMKALRRGQ